MLNAHRRPTHPRRQYAGRVSAEDQDLRQMVLAFRSSVFRDLTQTHERMTHLEDEVRGRFSTMRPPSSGRGRPSAR